MRARRPQNQPSSPVRYLRGVAELGAPASYLTLHKGAPVLSRQGVQVGTLHVVVADSDGFDALVVDVNDRLRVALADEIEAIHEGGVVLAYDTGACARLPEAQPAA
jgi:hypothetical protein